MFRSKPTSKYLKINTILNESVCSRLVQSLVFTQTLIQRSSKPIFYWMTVLESDRLLFVSRNFISRHVHQTSLWRANARMLECDRFAMTSIACVDTPPLCMSASYVCVCLAKTRECRDRFDSIFFEIFVVEFREGSDCEKICKILSIFKYYWNIKFHWYFTSR